MTYSDKLESQLETLKTKDEIKLAKRRASKEKRRAEHIAKGLCTVCSRPSEGKVYCSVHRASYNKTGKETYQWKKEKGYCTKSGCWEFNDGSTLCTKHHKHHNTWRTRCRASVISLT